MILIADDEMMNIEKCILIYLEVILLLYQIESQVLALFVFEVDEVDELNDNDDEDDDLYI